MLAVELMDPGRTWDLLAADNSMMANAKANFPSPSPAFLAERQAVSPTSQILPAARGSLGRRRPVQPPRRRQGNGGSGSNGGSGGGGGGGRSGDWKASGSAGTAETSASEGSVAGRGPNDNTSAVGGSHPRAQGQYSRDEEGRVARAQGARSGGGGSGGGVGARGRRGCGEAWGLSAVTLAQGSDRVYSSGGAGSSRGSKGSSTSDVWAWSGSGGGAARGKAMLSAYGLQTGKHNPTCPRGTPGDGSARLGRWYSRGPGSSTDHGVGGGKADAEELHEKCRSAESGGIGEYRSGVGSDGMRCDGGNSAPDRAACGHGQRSRASKARKHRPSETLSKSHAATRRSGDQFGGVPSGERRHGVWDTVAEDSDGKCGETLLHAATEASRGGDGVSVAATIVPTAPTPRLTEPPASREHPEGDHQSADHIWRALEDILVPPRGSTSHGSSASALAPHRSGCCVPGVVAAAAAAAADSGQVAVLTMDGRGGSAAPPHRPSQLALRAPACEFYSPVLPDLAGTEAEAAGALPNEAESSSCGQASGENGNVGTGDDHSTPPVSRQRAHSHHSPWQARKHPRGFKGGRGGAVFGRCHHYHQERSLVGEQAPVLGENTSACLSPSSLEPGASQIADVGNPVTTSAAAAATAVAANTIGVEDVVPRCAAPPIAIARSPAEMDAAGDEDASRDQRTSSADYCSAVVASAGAARKSNRGVGAGAGARAGTENPSTATALASKSVSAATVECSASTREAFFGEGGAAAGAGREVGGLDPFDRPTGDAVGVSPQSQLIDHFKLAPRPTSRRGSRHNQGAEEDAVKPAFRLFSGHRDDRASGAGAAADGRSKSREDGRRERGHRC